MEVVLLEEEVDVVAVEVVGEEAEARRDPDTRGEASTQSSVSLPAPLLLSQGLFQFFVFVCRTTAVLRMRMAKA